MTIKRLIASISLSVLASSAFANVTPADGFYFGGIGGVTASTTNHSFTVDQPSFVYIVNISGNPFVFASPGDNPNYSNGGGGGDPYINSGGSADSTGSLNYRIGGDAGGQIGFRWGHIRAEGEYLFDKNSYRSVTINGNEYTHGTDQPFNTIGVGGFTETNSLFVNGYYDFFAPDDQSDLTLVPYLGVGIGYSQVVNKLQFSETFAPADGIAAGNPYFSNTESFHNTGSAYQGIVGVAYYLDTDTSFSIDYRYVSTPTFSTAGVSSSSFSSLKPNNRFNISTLNISVNFNFDGVMGG